jgi:hypothetical protein
LRYAAHSDTVSIMGTDVTPNTCTDVTLYSEMALERAVDPVMRDVRRSYTTKFDALLDAIFAAAREREPHSEICPMCGGGLVKAEGNASEPAPQGRKRWQSTSLMAGMGIGAVATLLGAVGLGHYMKIRERSRSDRLVTLLRAHPGRPIGELAAELYGEDTQANRSKVRALLAQLGRLGKLRNVGSGRWEAIDGQDDEEEPN